MSFDIELRKKRPFWKEVVICAVYSVGLWAVIQGAMNFSAYAQIIQFKAESATEQVVEVKENIASWAQANLIPNKLEPIERYPDIADNTNRIAPHDNDHFIFQDQKLEKRNQFKQILRDMEVHPSDNRIYLPRINKNVPLVRVPNHKDWTKLESVIQSGLQKGVVVHPFSRSPGQLGNFFITGHSSYYTWDKGRFKDVFALLHEVQIGDEIEVFWDGKKYVYEVKEEKIVTPMQVDVLDHPFDRSILSLMTCTPVGTNKKRLVVTAELVGDPLKALMTAQK
ncbi:MAG TPA: sortase [Candidatus Gracilibacteria bacterium]